MYNFENAAKIISGKRALENVSFEMTFKRAKNAFLITEDLVDKLGYLKKFLSTLDDGNIKIARIYSKTPEVATVDIVEKMLALYKEYSCDSIIAIGRSSVLSVAKAVKLLLNQDVSRIVDLKSGVIINDKVPLHTVPIFLGCGEEATKQAIIFDKDNNKCYELDSANMKVDCVFIDPRMTEVVPPNLLASEGLYILTTALATCMNPGTNPIAKTYAKTAFKIVIENLFNIIMKPKKLDVQSKLCDAKIYVGVAKCDAPLVLNDIIVKKISRMYQISHEKISTILFMSRFGANVKFITEEIEELLISMIGMDEYVAIEKEHRGERFFNEFKDYYIKIVEFAEVHSRLRDFDISRNDFSKIAENVLFDADRNKVGPYRFQTVIDILNTIY